MEKYCKTPGGRLAQTGRVITNNRRVASAIRGEVSRGHDYIPIASIITVFDRGNVRTERRTSLAVVKIVRADMLS